MAQSKAWRAKSSLAITSLPAGSLAVVLVLAFPTALLGAPVTYTIVPERSEVVVQVFKAGVAARLAHDHVIRATRFAGTFSGDPAQPTTAAATITVETDSLRADEPEMRHKYGLPKPLSDKDRRSVESTMLGPEQLDAARYPTIRFRLTRISPDGPDRWRVTGEFSLHGIVRSITAPVTAQLNTETLHAFATFDILQSDFGIRPYAMFLGAVRNQDRVRISVDVTAQRQ